MKEINFFIKRTIDLFGSLIGIVILTPILVIIALSIKLTSKGPVFFSQERVGKNGEIFKILKFRSMVVNAENIGLGLFVRSDNDNRITKVGKFLRASSLDELPQLWNVVTGEMSLVGPRPPVSYHPYKFDEYSDFQRKRFDMKPGITGLSQVNVRNSVSWDEKILIDVEYIEKFNIFLDIKILLKTIQILFKRENIYTQSGVKGSEKTSHLN